MSSVPYDMPGDPTFSRLLGELGDSTDQCWITPIDNEHLPVTYATLNFLPFLQGPEAWISLSLCQTATPEDFELVGKTLARAVQQSDRRVVLIASGALSHTFHHLRDVRQHEAADASSIYSVAARDADLRVLAALELGDHAQVLREMPTFALAKPEGRFGHYLIMAAALGGISFRAPGRAYSQYENAIGTGQAHVWFDRPSNGWTGGDS